MHACTNTGSDRKFFKWFSENFGERILKLDIFAQKMNIPNIINQLPLFVTYRVFIVHKLHYIFRLYSHPQVYHIYKNAKIIIIT
jgi:hypothetical protein